MITPAQSVHTLLLATLQRFVAADAQIVSSSSIPLQGGMSGSAVARHTIQYTAARGASTISLITKDADRHEWRVLQHLQSQQQSNIPFAHTIDTGDDERLQICLQDVGDQNRPTSLDPITDTELAREAAGLAAIHAANFQPQAALDWLPAMSSSSIHDMLFVRAWRPAWERAVADPHFATTFWETIPRIEAAAATIVADMQALLNEPAAQTLIRALPPGTRSTRAPRLAPGLCRALPRGGALYWLALHVVDARLLARRPDANTLGAALP